MVWQLLPFLFLPAFTATRCVCIEGGIRNVRYGGLGLLDPGHQLGVQFFGAFWIGLRQILLLADIFL